ncbi:hypothetical protein QQ045_012376 [Rhodiola kirilowii]
MSLREHQQREEDLKAKEAKLIRTNPLINNPTSMSVKRMRYGDHVVFENQARGEIKTAKYFINDTIRSDVHMLTNHNWILPFMDPI